MSELQKADASLPKLTLTFSTGANPAIVKTHGSSTMLVCAEMHGTEAAICGVKCYTHCSTIKHCTAVLPTVVP